jgi:hypothetical protein
LVWVCGWQLEVGPAKKCCYAQALLFSSSWSQAFIGAREWVKHLRIDYFNGLCSSCYYNGYICYTMQLFYRFKHSIWKLIRHYMILHMFQA